MLEDVEFAEFRAKLPTGAPRNYATVVDSGQCFEECQRNVACAQATYNHQQEEINCYLYFERWPLRDDIRYTTLTRLSAEIGKFM